MTTLFSRWIVILLVLMIALVGCALGATPSPTAPPMATSTPTIVPSFMPVPSTPTVRPTTPPTATPAPPASLQLEAEAGSGGSTIPRSNASKQKSVSLTSNQFTEIPFSLPAADLYAVTALYSNDGDADIVQVLIDGVTAGQFQSNDTRPVGGEPGEGWNNFADSGAIGALELGPGSHTLKVVLLSGDQWGVEIDQVTLSKAETLMPPTVAPTATTPPTIAPTATTPPTVGPTATTPPTVGPTATTPPTVGPTATTPPTAPASLELEAENGVFTGSTMPRGNASMQQTVLLTSNQFVEMTFSLPAAASYAIAARYSNDGAPDIVQVLIDGASAGQFQSNDTRPVGEEPGKGWNNFADSGVIGALELGPGSHTLKVVLLSGDQYGVEIDQVTLSKAN